MSQAATDTPPTVHQALIKVMTDVGAVRKQEKNTHQGFSFRGIDTVVKAVYPALIKYGVTVHPKVQNITYDAVSVGSRGSVMQAARVLVTYLFTGPAGDSVAITVAAESFDSGDKATAKAMSVALRTALLQTLMLPTDEPDPDSYSYGHDAPAKSAPAKSTPKTDPDYKAAWDAYDKAIDSLGKTREEASAKWRAENGDITQEQFEALPIGEQVPHLRAVVVYAQQQMKEN